MIFQKLNSSHLESVLKILKSHEQDSKDFQRFGLAWSKIQTENALVNDVGFGLFEGQILLSFIFGRKIGASTFEIDMTMTGVENLKKGFMEKLFNEMVQSLQKGGVSEIWLEVHEENQAAVHFYKKIGFLENTKRPKYYPDGKAAILMTFRL